MKQSQKKKRKPITDDMITEFHADDFGYFRGQSRRILACSRKGAVNGISLFANGEDLDQCLGMLSGNELLLSVHLNLMTGRSLSPASSIPLLTDSDGVFRVHFRDLVLCFLSGRRRDYKEQIKTEFRAQIRRLLPLFEERGMPLRLDGHAHWHMVPVAFDAMMELVRDEFPQTAYIRIPVESPAVYRGHLREILPVPPLNLAKCLILMLFARRNLRKWRRETEKMEWKVFLGVLFSGCFDIKRARAVLPSARAYARKTGRGLELLAHPGSVREAEDLARVTNEDDRRFFTDRGRLKEAAMFRHLRGN